jgi:glucokinase
MHLLCADIGGTNGRLEMWAQANGTLQLEFSHTFRMAEYTGLGSMLTAFINMAEKVTPADIGAVVLAICGPVWESGRMNDPNNMVNADGSRWPFQVRMRRPALHL